MAGNRAIEDAIAAQLTSYLIGTADPAIEHLQIDNRMIPNPTPPSIDVYPAEEFMVKAGMGKGNVELQFTVRARVGFSDNEGGQDLLLDMMERTGARSITAALESDDTLGSTVEDASVLSGPTGFSLFPVTGSTTEQLVGCTWTVRVLP